MFKFKYTPEFVANLPYDKMTTKQILWHCKQHWKENIAALELGFSINSDSAVCPCCQCPTFKCKWMRHMDKKLGMLCPLWVYGSCCGGNYKWHELAITAGDDEKEISDSAQAIYRFILDKWKEA